MYTYHFNHNKPYYNRYTKMLLNADGTQAPEMLITRYTDGYHRQMNGVEDLHGGKAWDHPCVRGEQALVSL